MSVYTSSLSVEALGRYKAKLKCLFGEEWQGLQKTDPYQLADISWKDDISLWPPLEYPSLYNYLINTPGEFTGEKLKAYKSLEAYNYYKSGWVHTVFFHDLGNDNSHCILKAKVNPSQRLSQQPHEPWVAVKKTCGTIVTAHCTCMAGLGEVCSHVAALLFKVEACIRLGVASMSCTSLPCVWNQAFSKKVQPCPVNEISFDRPKLSKDGQPLVNRTKLYSQPVSKASDQAKFFIDSVSKVAPSAAIFSIIPGYAREPLQTMEVEPSLPPLISSLYDPKFTKYSEKEVRLLIGEKWKEIICTQEEADFLQESTSNQASSSLWHDYRVGRITSSIFGRVAKCAHQKYPTSLVQSIMKYSGPSENIPALKWGRINEDRARQHYCDWRKEDHINFSVSKSGLCINPQYPYLGASPDGFVTCSCCGDGLLEIKCTYKHRNSKPCEIEDDKFYLKKDKHGFAKLKESHDYYYQVQGQLGICKKSYCDFVCWTPKGFNVERIQADPAFFRSMIPKLKNFFYTYLFPEILTHKMLNGSEEEEEVSEEESSENTLYCICRQEAFGKMVACDNSQCPIEWFHYSCVGLKDDFKSEDEWYCSSCQISISS